MAPVALSPDDDHDHDGFDDDDDVDVDGDGAGDGDGDGDGDGNGDDGNLHIPPVSDGTDAENQKSCGQKLVSDPTL